MMLLLGKAEIRKEVKMERSLKGKPETIIGVGGTASLPSRGSIRLICLISYGMLLPNY